MCLLLRRHSSSQHRRFDTALCSVPGLRHSGHSCHPPCPRTHLCISQTASVFLSFSPSKWHWRSLYGVHAQPCHVCHSFPQLGGAAVLNGGDDKRRESTQKRDLGRNLRVPRDATVPYLTPRARRWSSHMKYSPMNASIHTCSNIKKQCTSIVRRRCDVTWTFMYLDLSVSSSVPSHQPC